MHGRQCCKGFRENWLPSIHCKQRQKWQEHAIYSVNHDHDLRFLWNEKKTTTESHANHEFMHACMSFVSSSFRNKTTKTKEGVTVTLPTYLPTVCVPAHGTATATVRPSCGSCPPGRGPIRSTTTTLSYVSCRLLARSHSSLSASSLLSILLRNAQLPYGSYLPI